MKRTTVAWAMTIAAIAWSGPEVVRAQQVATPAEKEPRRVEGAARTTSLRLLAPEAELLFDAMRRSVPEITAQPAPPETDATEPGGGVPRIFQIQIPFAVNASDRFEFQDTTDRSASPATPAPDRVRSVVERRAAVEAFRRSLSLRRTTAK